MQKTFYDVLGVSSRATRDEIKAAFRKKAQQVHPDKIQAQIANLDPYAAERLKKALEEDFRDLKEAYDVLSDARQRKEYDDLLKQIQATSAPPPFTPSPSQATPGPSAPASGNHCTVCGATLVGNSCPACAKPKASGVVVSAAGAFSLVISSIIGFFVAITVPRENSWDSDTCIGILIVLGIAVFWAFKKGFWGGIKRVRKTRPVLLALTVEAFSLVVLSLVVAVYNPPPKAASTLTRTASVPMTIADVGRSQPMAEATSVETKVPAGKPMRVKLTPNPVQKVEQPNAEDEPELFPLYGSIGGICGGGAKLYDNQNLTGSPIALIPTQEVVRIGPRYGMSFAVQEYDFETQTVEHVGFTSVSCIVKAWNPNQSEITGTKETVPVTSRTTTQEPPSAPNIVTTNGASARPTLSSLSSPEQQSIESACLHEKLMEGPAAYDRCLQGQLNALGAGPRRPDLSGLTYPEQQSIESACLHEKLMEGPALYNRCLQDQLRILSAGPRRPDLSGLSSPEQQSIESVCLHDKLMEGPAAYNRCLIKQLDLLRDQSR